MPMPLNPKTMTTVEMNALTAKFDAIVAENDAIAAASNSIIATNDANSPTHLIRSLCKDKREGDVFFCVKPEPGLFFKKTIGAVY